jgi:arabinofuranosyltransferase
MGSPNQPVSTKFDLAKLGILICLLILLSGSILHTLAGNADLSQSPQHSWGNDDAYIGYRYAKNLVDGKGLVFNPGERVEAYTDPLYVLMLAPGFWVTDSDGIYFYSVLLNLLFATAAFFLFVSYLEQQLGRQMALAGAFLFALCLPLWVAVASGLETPFVLAVMIAVWVLTERVVRDPSARTVGLLSLAMVATVLARADGFIFVGAALFYLLLKHRYRALAICGVISIAVVGIHVLIREAYYGAPLPTSYYVKVAGPLSLRFAHALDQLGNIAAFDGLMPFLLVILWVVGGIILSRSGRFVEELRFDLLFPFVWLAYWFYIGGDIFFDRFAVILYPLGIFALLKLLSRDTSRAVMGFVVAALAIMEVLAPFKIDPRFHYRLNQYDCLITTGKLLRQEFPGKTMATGALGKIPFFSGLMTEDILGLADPVLAHRSVPSNNTEFGHLKYNPDYTLSRNPDLIVNWIDENLDTSYGLTRAKYEPAGYRIRFLINSMGDPSQTSIINVEGENAPSIQQWVARGYALAVLVKE